MSEAPERIWAEPGLPGYLDEPNICYTVEYVRADRIEELEKELEYWRGDSAAGWDKCEEYRNKLAKEIEISNQRGNHIEFVLTPQMSDLHFQIKDVKAQLAKAMDAIDGLLAVLPDDEGPEIDYARITIAELKGEANE